MKQGAFVAPSINLSSDTNGRVWYLICDGIRFYLLAPAQQRYRVHQHCYAFAVPFGTSTPLQPAQLPTPHRTQSLFRLPRAGMLATIPDKLRRRGNYWFDIYCLMNCRLDSRRIACIGSAAICRVSKAAHRRIVMSNNLIELEGSNYPLFSLAIYQKNSLGAGLTALNPQIRVPGTLTGPEEEPVAELGTPPGQVLLYLLLSVEPDAVVLSDRVIRLNRCRIDGRVTIYYQCGVRSTSTALRAINWG